MINSNICEKLIVIDFHGVKYTKPKKNWVTADNAIAEAKRLNELKSSQYKVTAYHCTVCGGYHVGRKYETKMNNFK
jgi:hypothetical protein